MHEEWWRKKEFKGSHWSTAFVAVGFNLSLYRCTTPFSSILDLSLAILLLPLSPTQENFLLSFPLFVNVSKAFFEFDGQKFGFRQSFTTWMENPSSTEVVGFVGIQTFDHQIWKMFQTDKQIKRKMIESFLELGIEGVRAWRERLRIDENEVVWQCTRSKWGFIYRDRLNPMAPNAVDQRLYSAFSSQKKKNSLLILYEKNLIYHVRQHTYL